MQWSIWIFFGLVLKIPVASLCWVVWRAATDLPDQVLGEGHGEGGIEFAPGTRVRGPHGGSPAVALVERRGNAGHTAGRPPVREHTARDE